MRIKKLEIIGFKSFKNRTTIYFDHGITGIVGPNGCGKSNIVDALIWVMGEMSAKHLRGSAMSDVIFAGTDNQAPLGMAEVSLVLENSGGPFPSKYSRYSEIMVTRRLHRSGETNYLINKEPARLRDIQEIFMDTGAGSKGFSIVEQGRIGEIVTSKPGQRRVLIEEVAGITKFKVRKRESQRKLTATDKNLTRLQDIISEQKRQLNSVEKQAQKAEKYRALKQKIQDKDLWLASQKYLRMDEEEKQAEGALTEWREREASHQSLVERQRTELERLRLEVVEKEVTLNDLQVMHQRKRDQARDQEERIRQLTSAREQSRRDEEKVSSLLEQYRARQKSLFSEKKKLDAHTLQLKSDLGAIREKLEARESSYEEQRIRVDQMDESLTQKHRKMLVVSSSHSHLEAKKLALEAQWEQAKVQWQSASEVAEELKAKQKEFEDHHCKVSRDLEGQRQIQLGIMKDVENFEENLQTLSQQKEACEAQVQKLKDHQSEVAGRRDVLQNIQKNFEDFQQGVRAVLLWQQEKQDLLSGQKSFLPLSEIIEVPEEYEWPMEAVLGYRLQILLSETHEESLRALAYLKEGQRGCSSFLSQAVAHGGEKTLVESTDLEKREMASESGFKLFLFEVVSVAEPYKQQVIDLISGVVVVDSLSTAFHLSSRYRGYIFVTMQGETLSPDGVLTGGSRENMGSGLLQRRREIRELSSKCEEVSEKLLISQTVLQKLERQHERMQRDREGAKQSHEQQGRRVFELTKECERAEMEVHRVEEALRKQDQVIDEGCTQVQKYETQHKELVDLMKQTYEEKQKLEGEVEGLTESLGDFRAEVESIQGEVLHLRVEKAAKEQMIEGLRNQEKILDSSLKEVKEQLERTSKESDKNLESLSDHQTRIEKGQVELEQFLHEVQELERVLSLNQSEYEEWTHQIRQVDGQLSQSLTTLSDYQTQMNEAQLKWDQLRMEGQYLVDRIEEKYMLDIRKVYQNYKGTRPNGQVSVKETVREEASDREVQPRDIQRAGVQEADIQRVEEELEGDRTQLKRMGEVNLSAISEYDDLMERNKFLSSQCEDLVESRDQLKRVIERINRICSNRFKETFEQVNERFKRVFPVLFGGGHAELILCEEPKEPSDFEGAGESEGRSEKTEELEKNHRSKKFERGEEGVDIMASPPGKKLQNLSLLSGGEKALTAVSLIFSIFLVKPSPFCLLDEVDAPLDDANVSRFNDLVVEMSKRSQIIVVTHNKYTMRANNRLFGVTMEEKGVSKMVSVNLSAVEGLPPSREKVVQDV